MMHWLDENIDKIFKERNNFMRVDKNKCPQNHKCPAIKVCKVQAISQNGYSLPVIDESVCVDCGECIEFCPMGAISRET
jgi:ferredoxin